MLIKNKTNLEYATIGMLIDNIMKSNVGNTNYYGKIEVCDVEVGSHKIRIHIRYLKRYVEWFFEEVKK